MVPQSFKDAIQFVDSLAEIDDHPIIQHAIRIRPSHPRYLEAVIRAGENARCMGVLIGYMREEEFFPQMRVAGFDGKIVARKLSRWERFQNWLRSLRLRFDAE